ncbi:hypothetical protein [Bifidobacterium crudilactis]|jgi:hypothetical protein|uniref:hypothetical protein n=1 Tax=Bifidobacterium crudilactis TaxID=327277 RepID=UPI002354E681|nr:hypothetical protein [Bifidobacterium crudilactis]MCI1218484.1 hypothetical protein [Bifidobacterium crudilactis]
MNTTTTTITATAGDLHEQILNVGYAKAVRDYCDPLYHAWTDSLEHGGNATDEPTRLRLAAGMRESLAIRDALIMSTVTNVDDPDTMLAVAAEPHEPVNVRIMCDALTRAFDNPKAVPDPWKCTAALDILDAMTRELQAAKTPDAYLTQPAAVSAYLQWWNHRPAQARLDSQAALVYDPQTTLAAIVLSAIDHNITPAWTR